MRYLPLLLLFAGCAASNADVLTIPDRARLGTEYAYELLGGSGPAPTPTPAPAGDVCPECGGRGKVGDGTIDFTCPECGGTGKKKAAEPETEPCEPAEPEPAACEPAEPEPAAEPAPLSINVLRLPGPRWTFEGNGVNPPASVKAEHLMNDHGIDVTGMTSAEMSAVHDAAHNQGDSVAALMAAGDSPTVNCPTGNCPTESRSTTTVRRGLFGRLRR